MVANNNCFDVDEARKLITDPRYIIDEFIGSGAMACVYKVRERGTPNVYALKLLREQYRQRKRFKEIFQREATHMRDLQYPNIVRFYKFVLEEHSAYILMDYVQGKALTDYIRQSRQTGQLIAIDKIVRIMAQIARAISYLHTEGFIHRDVKPGNILLVGEDESAFLTDLGIAGAMDEPSLSGAGTPSYMPYEQQTRATIDHTVDTYAFGIMLYELFTGEKPFTPSPSLPFEEARKAIVELHRKAPVPPISAKRSDLPPIIDTFFEQALAKTSGERYPDILDFARDIHEALLPLLAKDLQDFDNIQAQEIDRSVERVVEVEVPADSNRVIFGGIAAIVIITLLVFGGIRFNNQNNTATETPAIGGENTAELTGEAASQSETQISPAATAEIRPGASTILENVTINTLAEGVETIGYGDDLNTSVQYIASVRDGFVPLQLPDDVNAFRVELSLEENSLEENQQFGLAFRIQDDANYLLFSVDTTTAQWSLNLIQNNEMTVVQTAAIEGDIPSTMIVTAEDEFIRIDLADTVIQQTQDTWESGAVALWLPPTEADPLEVSNLAIALIGDNTIAVENTGTTIPALQFLLEDIQALRATGDENSIVDCSQFTEIYDRLDNHSDIRGTDDFISEAKLTGTVIFTDCDLERDNPAVEFSFSDYLDWETDLGNLIIAIETAIGTP